jgi:hypothetical protein
MADAPKQRKAVAEKTVDWLSKPYVAYTAHVEKQRRLFEMFSAFVAESGGWVTSLAGQKWVRFEVPPLSEIPIRLREKNIPLVYVGESTRVASSNIAMPVTVFETKLG